MTEELKLGDEVLYNGKVFVCVSIHEYTPEEVAAYRRRAAARAACPKLPVEHLVDDGDGYFVTSTYCWTCGTEH